MLTCEWEDGRRTSLRHVTSTAIVLDDSDRLLLTRRAPQLLQGGRLAIPGGYMDRDEDIRTTIVREVREETGYESTIEFLFRVISRPNRPGEDRQNVDFVFVLRSGALVGTPDWESTEVFWHALDDIPAEGLAFDQSETLEMFLSHRRKPMELPLLD